MLAALRELRGEMKSAIESPLMPNRQQRVLELLRDRPALAHRCGVFPDVLPSLAENNPPVAAELLLCLARNHPAPSHNLPAHFDALVSMPTSLHSMEVVNKLVSEASELLPDDFVRAYVAQCISAVGWSRIDWGRVWHQPRRRGRRSLVGVSLSLGNALTRHRVPHGPPGVHVPAAACAPRPIRARDGRRRGGVVVLRGAHADEGGGAVPAAESRGGEGRGDAGGREGVGRDRNAVRASATG